MKLRKLILSTTAVAGLALAPAVAHASTFNVLVGYADNLRASGFFPTDWLGSPGTVSESSAVQSFDSGAIRIDNTSGANLQITNFTVTMGFGAVYNIWSTLNIGVGQRGIFTQTTAYNFDSSDNAFGSPPGNIFPLDPGANGIGGCSSTGAAQSAAGITSLCDSHRTVISFLANGTPFSFEDTGHILDTGLYDFVNNSPDGNESINWNTVGGGPERGGNATPLPGALPLFTGGLGVIGLFGWRRKKKAAALAA